MSPSANSTSRTHRAIWSRCSVVHRSAKRILFTNCTANIADVAPAVKVRHGAQSSSTATCNWRCESRTRRMASRSSGVRSSGLRIHHHHTLQHARVDKLTTAKAAQDDCKRTYGWCRPASRDDRSTLCCRPCSSESTKALRCKKSIINTASNSYRAPLATGSSRETRRTIIAKGDLTGSWRRLEQCASASSWARCRLVAKCQKRCPRSCCACLWRATPRSAAAGTRSTPRGCTTSVRGGAAATCPCPHGVAESPCRALVCRCYGGGAWSRAR